MIDTTYELADGTVLTGERARYCRWLDGADPLARRFRNDTDVGTASDFAAANPDAAWCEEARRLVAPTGFDSWTESPRERVTAMVAEFCEARLAWAESRRARAEDEGDEGMAKAAAAYARFAKGACSNGRVSGAASLFCCRVTVRASMLNMEPSVIGTPDGVVDLDSGELLYDSGERGAREWRVTKQTRARVWSESFGDTDYDPRWDEFVDEIMCGDPERADYLQRALGYSVFGGNPEECMFVAYGATTRNGKGTLMESVAWALGDYAAAVDHDYLMEGRPSGGADEETASLDGVRLVTISEPTKGRRLDEAKVKMLTGGDMVSCRHLYGPQFSYRPQFTMWMSCNTLPVVGDTTVFRSKRVRVVPFERHFDEGEQDEGLKARFRTEDGMRTVLEWLLNGYLMYRERGLEEPASVRAATDAYAGVGGSTLARFVDECCEVRGGGRLDVPDFNAAYKAFCEELDEPALSAAKVRREFEQRGIAKRMSHGTRYYAGIALNEAGVGYAVDGMDSDELFSAPQAAPHDAPGCSRDGSGGADGAEGAGNSGGHRIKLS